MDITAQQAHINSSCLNAQEEHIKMKLAQLHAKIVLKDTIAKRNKYYLFYVHKDIIAN